MQPPAQPITATGLTPAGHGWRCVLRTYRRQVIIARNTVLPKGVNLGNHDIRFVRVRCKQVGGERERSGSRFIPPQQESERLRRDLRMWTTLDEPAAGHAICDLLYGRRLHFSENIK